ncbi:hypothetical protein EfmAA242_10170 [Enterococcus faecium]|nr:hypothetical protein EfmAA242_10170 [Enterococcus faecium]
MGTLFWLVQKSSFVNQANLPFVFLSNLDIDYSDSFTLIIEHETGIVGTLSVDVVSRVAKRNLTIIGEKILIEWEGNPDSLFSWNEETSSMTIEGLTFCLRFFCYFT